MASPTWIISGSAGMTERVASSTNIAWWHRFSAPTGQLLFKTDLPLADQVIALATLATLTTPADQASATSLLAALPNQGEVTRIPPEALVMWAHWLYPGPNCWNPLQPDLLAEQQLADTAQLPTLAAATARLAAGQPWEAGLLTQLLAELTRPPPRTSLRSGRLLILCSPRP